MKLPHFSIATLMALVALVALDFGVVQNLIDPSFLARELSDLLVFGFLPMANVLVLGLLPFLTRSGRTVSRPKRLGFEFFGAAGLLLYLICCVLVTHAIHEGVPSVLWFLESAGEPFFLVGATLLLLLPQLSFACFGAWLFGKHYIQRREPVEKQDVHDGTISP